MFPPIEAWGLFFFQIDFFMWIITIILSVVPIHVIIFKDAGKYSFYYQIRGTGVQFISCNFFGMF